MPPELHSTGSWKSLHKTRGWLNDLGLNHSQSPTPYLDPAQNWQPWTKLENHKGKGPAACELVHIGEERHTNVCFGNKYPRICIKIGKIQYFHIAKHHIWTLVAILASCTCCQLSYWPIFEHFCDVMTTVSSQICVCHELYPLWIISTLYPKISPRKVTSKISKISESAHPSDLQPAPEI